MSKNKITIVVVPRERFSCTQASLESIYQHTQMPFDLIYIDGNSPPKVQSYLQHEASERKFSIIRTEHYLFPNQARNIGRVHVKTPYLVFIDNDVLVTPGWLTALLQCAEKHQADVVGPLMCHHEPLHEEIHFAGGESHVWVDKTGRRRLREKMYRQGQKVEAVKHFLTTEATELAEFHCVLVKQSIFEKVGALDEEMCNTKEHLDFCMAVREQGGTVYFAADSVVTYVPGPPLEWGDLHYYMLRWSDDWTLRSLRRLKEKWNLSEDAYFTTKYKKLGWRRKMTVIAPVVKRLTFGLYSPKLERILMWLDHRMNCWLTNRHAQAQRRYQTSTSSLSEVVARSKQA
ncbi:MAG: glycosyltransferase family 2 protein [Leptolyngbyaceae cyanobacterium]